MRLAKQLQAMARVARKQGDKENAESLERVARWAVTFKGFQSAPLIGPRAPSIAGEATRATVAALLAASARSELQRAEIAAAYAAGGRR